jgi:thiamine pyrophosphokinase
MRRTAIALANGELGELQPLRKRHADLHAELVIAADGGARHAASLGLPIDRLIGDLDSLPSERRAELARRGTIVVQRPADKDETDLELALLDAREQGMARVIVLGALGARLDMTLANVGLLLHPALRGVALELWSGAETAFVLRPPGGAIPAAVGSRVSLIPLGGEARGVTTHGLAFPLAAETLPLGPARGVSNRVIEPEPRLDLAAGTLLVVFGPRPTPPQEPSP